MSDEKIRYDEFQIERVDCWITGDECEEGQDCRDCQIALEYIDPLEAARSEYIDKITCYTNFERDGKVPGISCKVTPTNTVAKIDIENDIASIKKGFAGKHASEYKKCELKEEIANIESVYPERTFLKAYNALPTPDFYMYRKDSPLIIVYPGLIYAVAPKIED